MIMIIVIEMIKIMTIVIITIVIINDRYDKFVAVRCNNTGDPKKRISMHKIPFFSS